MIAIRRSKLCSSAALAVVFAGGALAGGVACGGPAALTTAPEAPSAARKPDGVHVEPPSAVPKAVDRAPAKGVVTLRLPTGAAAVEDLVRAYFAAFIREDVDGLERQLMTNDWVPLGGMPRSALKSAWAQRVKNFDYKQLSGTEVAHFDRIERYEYAELGGSGLARPPEMRQTDVLVRVPVAVARVGTEQLFPDTLVLLLRRDDAGRLRIAGVGEEGGN